jgi:hypothetical protein
MHVSKDSMWWRIWKILQNFLGTKQDPSIYIQLWFSKKKYPVMELLAASSHMRPHSTNTIPRLGSQRPSWNTYIPSLFSSLCVFCLQPTTLTTDKKKPPLSWAMTWHVQVPPPFMPNKQGDACATNVGVLNDYDGQYSQLIWTVEHTINNESMTWRRPAAALLGTIG